MTIPAFRRLFPDAPTSELPSGPQIDLPDAGIDSLYASFQAARNGDASSAFADPANSAFAYRIFIEELLNPEFGYRMTKNGARIPLGNLILAKEKFDTATKHQIWTPQDAPKDVRAKCERYRDVAWAMIEGAEAVLDGDLYNYEDRFESPEEESDFEAPPRDKAELYEKEFWEKRDFRLTKIKV